MAKSAKTEAAPKAKTKKGHVVLVWVLMAMLVAGLGGFGVTNFGGNVGNIAQVGDQDITVNQYARALEQEIQAFSAQVGQPVTKDEAFSIGLDRQVRQRLISQAALDNEAERIGISIGDERVAKEIMTVAAFKGPTGSFERDTYRFTLERNNMTEKEFEAGVRDDLSRSILQGSVASGFVAPKSMVDTLQNWLGEKRGFSLLRLTETDLATPLAQPTDADLKAFYDANGPMFTAPEAKRISYAALLPDMLTDSVQLDETALKQAYQDRITEFVQPERRLVERLVFPDDAAAAAAKAKLDAGATFETLVTDRGLQLTDVDMGEMSREDLGAAGDAVFALTEPGVVGPLPSDLGPALYRMNGILVAQETTFEEARETLVAEQSADAARREIADKTESIDDLLAGGATLEDLANEAGMQLGTIDYVPGADSPLSGYEAFRKAADAVKDGDFPELIQLDDGGIVAIRLDSVVPPTLKPFDTVRDQVVTAWQADALHKALVARANEAKTAVEGGESLGSFGIVETTASAGRDAFIEGAPADLITTVFQLKPGEMRVVDGPEFVALVRLDEVEATVTDGPDAEAMRNQLNTQVAQAIAQDAFGLFSSAVTAEAGITLNDAAISAVQAQLR
ncbi:MAG: peptidylprolyl isomerase [Cereibacter sphaeroides]|uniref:Peptidylprolyl isomerase n=1 Tax=Cereibacter sphaeroides TaxID=1063 RepID=A0A2W5TUU9_CERSP|nr:MAG: peptidylprolyl isomerase [Cereibacter sphaeroides]